MWSYAKQKGFQVHHHHVLRFQLVLWMCLFQRLPPLLMVVYESVVQNLFWQILIVIMCYIMLVFINKNEGVSVTVSVFEFSLPLCGVACSLIYILNLMRDYYLGE
jgi:hypothetical protein